MTTEIVINALHMNPVGHQSPGMWTHSATAQARCTDLAYWADLAGTLERGRIGALFLADVLGSTTSRPERLKTR